MFSQRHQFLTAARHMQKSRPVASTSETLHYRVRTVQQTSQMATFFSLEAQKTGRMNCSGTNMGMHQLPARILSWNRHNRSIGTSCSIHSYYEFRYKMFLAHDSLVTDFQSFPRNHSHPFRGKFCVTRETKNRLSPLRVLSFCGSFHSSSGHSISAAFLNSVRKSFKIE